MEQKPVRVYSWLMNTDNIIVVLVRPEESRNVGAVCRAMANCAMHTLRIVGRREDLNDEKVRVLAIHAAYIWEQATFFDSVSAATADCSVSAGTTRRRGKKRKGKLFLPEEFAATAERVTDGGSRAAIVFGNERTGLTDGELLECSCGVTIPSSAEFASLNLSHAVQVVAYELFRQAGKEQTGYTPLSRLDETVGAITQSLGQMGFFRRVTDDGMAAFWRQLLSRASLSEGEAQYIEKTFRKAAGLFTGREQERPRQPADTAPSGASRRTP